MQTTASMKSPATMRHSWRLASFAQPRQSLQQWPEKPFHGDNTGSNPVGDANKINNLDRSKLIARNAGDAAGTNAKVSSPDLAHKKLKEPIPVLNPRCSRRALHFAVPRWLDLHHRIGPRIGFKWVAPSLS